MLALALFLRGEVVEDPVAWEGTLEVQRFSERSIAAWAGVVTAGRTATDDEVAAAVDAARAQFAPDLPNPELGTERLKLNPNREARTEKGERQPIIRL